MRLTAILSGLLLLAPAGPAAAQTGDSLTITPLGGPLYLLDGAVDLITVSIGPDGVLLVDAGYPETERMVRAALRKLGRERVDILINTHYHHAFANPVFGAEAEIITDTATARRLTHPNLMFDRVVPAYGGDALPDRTFADSLVLRFNGEEILLYRLPRGHTDGDIAVVFRGSNVVAAGDVAVPHLPWTDDEAGGDFLGLLAAVDTLLARTPRTATIVPGHDRLMRYADLVAYREVLATVGRDVRRRMAAGQTLRAIVEAGVPAGAAAWATIIPARILQENAYRAMLPARRGPRGVTWRLENGRWFDGQSFRPRAMWVVDGVLRETGPPAADSVLDLAGGYVVPPYGDAHLHTFGDATRLAADSRDAIRTGVFHVMVQDPINEVTAAMRHAMAAPATVDVRWTQGVVTPSDGLIANFYRQLAARGHFGDGATMADLDGRVIFLMDSVPDVDRKWAALRAVNDDFIKVIVAFSGDDGRAADGPPAGVTGPVLAALARHAHADGLRVSAHVETAADVALAVEAGADIIAHLPASWQIGPPTGYPAGDLSPWIIPDSTAREIQRRGVTVITTAMPDADSEYAAQHREVHARNLRTLVRHGVQIVLGSDGDGILPETAWIRGLGVLDDLHLLRLLVEATPRFIHPDRRIGFLRDGYEASFLVLDGDPLADPSALERIRLRVKQGVLLAP